MLKELEGYDWEEAFGYAGEPNTNAGGSVDIRSLPNIETSREPFTREDVARLIGHVEGENDGPSWICAGELRDGRWFYLEAGCDYTGWDCQAGGSATVCDTEEQLRTYCVTQREAERFGWSAPSPDGLAKPEGAGKEQA